RAFGLAEPCNHPCREKWPGVRLAPHEERKLLHGRELRRVRISRGVECRHQPRDSILSARWLRVLCDVLLKEQPVRIDGCAFGLVHLGKRRFGKCDDISARLNFAVHQALTHRSGRSEREKGSQNKPNGGVHEPTTPETWCSELKSP